MQCRCDFAFVTRFVPTSREARDERAKTKVDWLKPGPRDWRTAHMSVSRSRYSLRTEIVDSTDFAYPQDMTRFVGVELVILRHGGARDDI